MSEHAQKDTSDFKVQDPQPELQEPGLYKVILHNDDFTPMDFVVAVLEMFFHMERIIATRVMYEVHRQGKAVCGLYSKDVAETKVDQVMNYARRHQYPLLCSVEAN